MNPITPEDTRYFLLTIDVEDWFQVENFKPWIPFSTWDQRELRVERNVHRLLDLFDTREVAGKPEAKSQKANRLESYEARMPGGSKNSEHSSLLASKHQASSVKPPSAAAGYEQLAMSYELAPKVHNELSPTNYELAPKVHNELSTMPAPLNFFRKTIQCIQPGNYELASKVHNEQSAISHELNLSCLIQSSKIESMPKKYFKLDNKQALDLAIKDLKDNCEIYSERFMKWLKK